MRYSVVAAGLVAAVSAGPLANKIRQSGPNDAQILNYALTLEYLESTFYNMTLAKYSAADFTAAGVSSAFYPNLQQIAFDEATHVSFLSGALKAAGYQAVEACTYNFDLSSVASVLATANAFETVGVSAYLGAAQYISNKAYLEAAGAILTVEARHSAYLRYNQIPKAETPFPSPFDIPLDFDEVYSIAAAFIASCPSSNPALPVKAFPALAAMPSGPFKIGDAIAVKPATDVPVQGAYFITVLGPVAAKIYKETDHYVVIVPAGTQEGPGYLVLTSDCSMPTDENISAGPALLAIADASQM